MAMDQDGNEKDETTGEWWCEHHWPKEVPLPEPWREHETKLIIQRAEAKFAEMMRAGCVCRHGKPGECDYCHHFPQGIPWMKR